MAESQIAALCGHDPLPHLPDVRRPRRPEGHQSGASWPSPSRPSYPIIKPYRDQIENKYQWCIAAVPGAAWAKKALPRNCAPAPAMEKLWEAILFTSRVTDDPVKAWEEHNTDLHDRCAYLNSLHIREPALHRRKRHRPDRGYDPRRRSSCGGGDTSLQGIFFNPNIPTEECFISPNAGRSRGHRLCHASP